jgi:hypothetical protein
MATCVDFRSATAANLHGLSDLEVLQVSAEEGILVTHDRKTMPYAFGEFIANRASPGGHYSSTAITTETCHRRIDFDLDRFGGRRMGGDARSSEWLNLNLIRSLADLDPPGGKLIES